MSNLFRKAVFSNQSNGNDGGSMNYASTSPLCWCGQPAEWIVNHEYGGGNTPLCKEHKPQYEMKLIRPAQYAPVPELKPDA